MAKTPVIQSMAQLNTHIIFPCDKNHKKGIVIRDRVSDIKNVS
jgi:hypothetical protein